MPKTLHSNPNRQPPLLMQNTNETQNHSEQNKPAFTPAPWTIEALPWNYTTINGINDETICYLHIEEEIQESELENAKETQYANARLIACAPELLALLEEVIQIAMLADKPSNAKEANLQSRTINSARKLIATAKGETNEPQTV